MTIGKSLLWVSRAAAALVTAGVLSGCGIQPGDYMIYRVSSGETDKSAGCFHPSDEPPPNEASDSSTIRGAGTWIIYASIEDKLYLDGGGEATLEGGESDDGYVFNGKVVDVEWMGLEANNKYTVTTTTTINIITDGDAISGTSVLKKSYGCSGPDCGDEKLGLEKRSACTATTPFVGTYVEDIELKHDI